MQLNEIYVMMFQSRPNVYCKGRKSLNSRGYMRIDGNFGFLDCSGCCCIRCRKRENSQMGETGIFVYLFTSVC